MRIFGHVLEGTDEYDDWRRGQVGRFHWPFVLKVNAPPLFPIPDENVECNLCVQSLSVCTRYFAFIPGLLQTQEIRIFIEKLE